MIPAAFAYYRPGSINETFGIWRSTAKMHGSSPADTALFR